MRLTTYGAAHEVTGSCYLVETGGIRFLVDCGMFQGQDSSKRNSIPSGLDPAKLEAVFLTHAHLDHCGRLPLLVKSGFSGPIYATEGTIEVAKIILLDAAEIQKADIERENRRRIRAGRKPIKPMFNASDVERVFELFRSVNYHQAIALGPHTSVNFTDAGHILGSSCAEVVTAEGGISRKVVFSGDLGQYNVPEMRDPEIIEHADVVVMESTYGDRDHRSLEETVEEFRQIVESAVRKRSKILIPSFAVGRTQLLLYYLAEMIRKKLVPALPIFLDSPMAIEASKAYLDHVDVFDAEISELLASGQLRSDLGSLVLCQTVQQSQALNAISGPCIIIAGAGMCTAGRILHHLKHNLWKEDCFVLIVGYQAGGSLGRQLVEGAKRVKVLGETVAVRATVAKLGGFSAHAGQSDLLRWLKPMINSKPRIILTHGEKNQLRALSGKIQSSFGLKCEIPGLADAIVIGEGGSPVFQGDRSNTSSG